jgi:hypothetical protein
VGKTAALVQNSNVTGHFQLVLGGIGTTLLILVFVFIFAGELDSGGECLQETDGPAAQFGLVGSSVVLVLPLPGRTIY